jgi:hypothetical protein
MDHRVNDPYTALMDRRDAHGDCLRRIARSHLLRLQRLRANCGLNGCATYKGPNSASPHTFAVPIEYALLTMSLSSSSPPSVEVTLSTDVSQDAPIGIDGCTPDSPVLFRMLVNHQREQRIEKERRSAVVQRHAESMKGCEETLKQKR